MTDADNSLMLSILKDLRAEMRQHHDLLLQLVDAGKRHDRRFDTIDHRFNHVEQRISDVEQRIGDSRGELELMLKGELLGRLTHFETRIDERLAEFEEKLNGPTTPRYGA